MKILSFAISFLLCACAATEAAPSRSFESLSKANQKLVKDSYGDLLAAHEKKDFARVNADAETILALVDDFRDTKAFASIAQRGLEQVKSEKDPEYQNRKERALRHIAALEIKGRHLLAKANSDPDSRAELYKVMKEIQAIDPTNTFPDEWRKKLHEE